MFEWDSMDPEGEIVSSSWHRDGVEMAFVQEDLPPGTYTYTLTVTDLQGASDSDTAVVTVVPLGNAAEILALAKEQAEREEKTRQWVSDGKTIEDLLNEFGRI